MEDRIVPAELLHSLFPDPTGPQPVAQFGYSVGSGSTYRVVGAARSDAMGVEDAGQAFVYDVATNSLLATLNNPTPAMFDFFGISVAVSGNYVVVGSSGNQAGAFGSGTAYVYDLNSMSPTIPVVTLNNPAPAAYDDFGSSVSISGKYVAVGAEADDTAGSNTGSAYVYDLNSIAPTVPIATLNNPFPSISRLFGHSISVSGNNLVVGTYEYNTGTTYVGSAYVYDLSSMSPTIPIAILNNPTPAPDDRFGGSVAISGHHVVVGAVLDDTIDPNGGSAYIYDLNSTTPTFPIHTLHNPEPIGGGFFGNGVAAFGNLVAIGAHFNGPGAHDPGAVYVYDLTSMSPTVPIISIYNPTPADQDYFGASMSMWGNQVVVGAHRDDTGAYETGSVYVYDLSSVTPTVPIIALHNPTQSVADYFGISVSASGNHVVVGAYLDDTGAANAGSVYLYDLNSMTPSVPIATLINPAPSMNAYFGDSVAVSGDFVVVGVYQVNNGAGLAYIYDLSSMTPSQPILTLNNPFPADLDFFGISVSVSGNHVVVGAYKDDTGAMDAGSAYVYDLSSLTPAVPIVNLINPFPAVSDWFGDSVAVSGNYVVVGAHQDDMSATDSGSAYVYDLSSSAPAVPIATLNNPSPASADYFGISVAVSANFVVVGAFRDDTGAADSGSAYVYDLNSITPTAPIAILNNPTPAVADYFGYSVSVSGNYVVVGANRDNTGSADSGSAYVYHLSSVTPTVPIATLNNPTPAVGDLFGISVAISGNRVVVGAIDNDQNIDQGSARVYTIAAAQVANVQINGGAAQRSRVNRVAVTFDQPVSFTGTPGAAFELKRQADGLVISLNAAVTGNTVTLTFVGGAVEFGSLADGRYTLTIDANQVFNSNGKLDGNGDGTGGDNFALVGTPANGLFRLFGDTNGDGAVATNDYIQFRLAIGGSSAIFDFDNDGAVAASDFIQFRLRFGGSI